MRDFKLPLDITQIQKCIPHRYPFLLIDRVLALTPGDSVVGIKQVSISEPMLQGHFPEFPVFPGVLVVEGMAQAAAVLAYYTLDSFKEILLTEVINTRFRKMIVPGDTLRYEMRVEKSRPPFFWFEGKALVDGEIVATARLSALLK